MHFTKIISPAGCSIEAGGIIRTVVVADTLENLAVLGLIILVRSLISVTLHLDMEGRWPWQTEDDRGRS